MRERKAKGVECRDRSVWKAGFAIFGQGFQVRFLRTRITLLQPHLLSFTIVFSVARGLLLEKLLVPWKFLVFGLVNHLNAR